VPWRPSLKPTNLLRGLPDTSANQRIKLRSRAVELVVRRGGAEDRQPPGFRRGIHPAGDRFSSREEDDERTSRCRLASLTALFTPQDPPPAPMRLWSTPG